VAKAVGAAGLTGIAVLSAVLGGCHSLQHSASPTSSSVAPTSSQSGTQPAAVAIAPLPVRQVQKSQPTTADRCPATNPNAPVAAADVLITCDLSRTTRYTLGPETMQLGLTHVDSPKSLTSGFYEVHLLLDPASATAWASFTAAHPHAHVAFIRDNLVLEAPMIEEHVTSGQIALTTRTPQAADQLAQLAGRPA